jgi:hypothetical protein
MTPALDDERIVYLSEKSRKYVVVDPCEARIDNHKTTFWIGSGYSFIASYDPSTGDIKAPP